MGNSLGTLAILKQLDPAKLVELTTNANKRLDEVRGLFRRRFRLAQPLGFTLCSFFNQPLSLPPKPLAENLKVILGKLAEQNFKARYDYAYEGKTSRPPNLATDPTTEITSIRGLCSITNETLGQITDYVKSSLRSVQLVSALD
jgi:hypothetical protein